MEEDYDQGLDEQAPPSIHTQFLDLTNGEGGELVGGGENLSSVSVANSAKKPPSAGRKTSTKFDPNTPGRVVETGQEHTGRWTKEEHEAFLSALQMYGKEWKKVAAKVKTRTVVQTRTHAQKYFQKLAKVVEGGDDSKQTGVKRSISTSAKKKPKIASATKPQRQNSVTSAAHLISKLSGAENTTTSGVSASAFHLAGTLNSNYLKSPAQGFRGGGLGSIGLASGGLSKPSLLPHGFTSYNNPLSAADMSPFHQTLPSVNSAFLPQTQTLNKAFQMHIKAPEPDAALKRGKFPEPSPAASGKRKLAEIAAARMLAGVAGLGGGKARMGSTMEDGRATPPPEKEVAPIPPPPPQFTKADSAIKSVRPSLQIVNPETLGVSYDQQKTRKDGQASPVTPWEGELKALMSEEKMKDNAKQADSILPKAPDIDSFGPSSRLHPVCGPGSAFDRSPLHKAVCELDLAVVESELVTRPPEAFQRRDSSGYCAIHSACALCMKDPQNSSIATDIVRALISAGADAAVRDSDGNTPLHWAARAGDRGSAEMLLFRNCPRDAQNELGETPLHWAMRAGRVATPVVSLLLENGASPAIWNKNFKRPIDVASDGFQDEEEPVFELKKLMSQRKRLTKEQRSKVREAAEQRKEARANLLRLSIQSRTLVLNHPECLEHLPKSSGDWEAPGRIISIMDRILGRDQKSNILEHEITVSQDFDRAKLDLLSRIHSTEYLSFVNDLSKELELKMKESADNTTDTSEGNGTIAPAVVPFTPMVQRTLTKVAASSVKLGEHSDTSFSVGSLRAARRAAGAVQHAVDCVLVGRNRNAFCIVRPPGHHAGINGLLDGGESCGFCIFNSVAAGAMHAISDERLLCERCAIVDIDVHHGNGTEEIVRKYHDPSKLFFFSIHLYDNESKGKKESKTFQYKFYPGTGDEDDVALNIINVPITPLWKRKDPVPAALSTHNTRKSARNKRDDESSESGTARASDAETETSRLSSAPSTPTNSMAYFNGGRHAYRNAIQNRLLPALRAFNPDLILISAGFDACKGDVGNAKHEFIGKEKMGLDLEPEDYAWTTRKILEIADICCQGRVVSVLEGGYGKTAPAQSDNAEVPLDKSLFSECAMRHVHAMIDPYDAEARFKSRND